MSAKCVTFTRVMGKKEKGHYLVQGYARSNDEGPKATKQSRYII